MSKKWPVLLVMAFLSVAWPPLLQAAPSVSISTTFKVLWTGFAVTYPDVSSGSFSAILNEVPKNHDEWTVGDPEYAWTIDPLDSSISFSPTDQATVGLNLLSIGAWGRRYGVSVVVTWIETNTQTGETRAITAQASISLEARPHVDKIQYRQPEGTWTDCPTTLYVLKGSAVVFKAVPTPLVAWPNNTPRWSGTSGASGYGETVSVSFGTLSSTRIDSKMVTASSGTGTGTGTGGNEKTAYVIVYELTGTLKPEDEFTGRSQTQYGLEEIVSLGFKTNPTDITAAQAGGLEWTRTGVGKLDGIGNGGTAKYDAQHVPNSVTFSLTVLSGPCKDQSKSYPRTVVAPTGTRMTRVSDRVWHRQNIASVGIELYYWLEPKTVSFKNLNFAENGAPAEDAVGVLTTIGSHPSGGQGPILGGNAEDGCRVEESDRAQVRVEPWNAGNGSFVWNIPTCYIANTGVRVVFGQKKRHFSEVFVTGRAEQTKDSRFDFAEAAWVDSNY